MLRSHGLQNISKPAQFVPSLDGYLSALIACAVAQGTMSAKLAAHQHGKGRVRLGRVWREGKPHHMVEWTVFTMLESDMAHAFKDGSNADMTATDTHKNTVSMLNVIDQRRSGICEFKLIRRSRRACVGLLYRQEMLATLHT